MNQSLKIVLAALTLSAGLTQAQVMYASGIEHDPVGGAHLGPLDGRRLPVNNIGSSGQDGVEIKLRSAWGGGGGVETPPFLGVPGSQITAKFKGWNGTIKGRVDFTSRGTTAPAHVTVDLSGSGAVAVQYTLLDATGVPVGGGTFPSGGVDMIDPTPCPDGSYPNWQPVVHETDFGQTYVVMELGCHGCFNLGGGDLARSVKFTPVFGPGGGTGTGMDSEIITARGVTAMAVTNAEMETFGFPVWGVGLGRPAEECTGPTCGQSQRRLPVNNLGSSGQDGVEVKLRVWGGGGSGGTTGGSNSDATLRSKKCPDCPPGHVTLIKFVDDAELTVTALSLTNNGTPPSSTSLRASSAGAGSTFTNCTAYSSTGAAVATWLMSATDSMTVADGASPGTLVSSLRQNCRRVYEPTSGPCTITLPSSAGGSSIAGVRSISFDAVNPTNAREMTRVRITSDNPGSIILEGVSTIVPTCVADVDDGSGSGTPDGGVTIDDLLFYLGLFSAGDVRSDVDDGSGTGTHDGGVTIDDLIYYLTRFSLGC